MPVFFHPDFTVGTGIAPVRTAKQLADFTAGRELHPAPKTRSCDLILLYAFEAGMSIMGVLIS